MAWPMLSKPRLIISNPASLARISIALETDSARDVSASDGADRLSFTG